MRIHAALAEGTDIGQRDLLGLTKRSQSTLRCYRDVLGVDGIQSFCDETAVSSTIADELLLRASGRLLP